MCCCISWCCSWLQSRCMLGFLRLVVIFMILDLALTIFIASSLWNADVFACCTSTSNAWNTDSYVAKCTYEDIGNADGIDVQLGYCERHNGNLCGTGLDDCASNAGVSSLSDLCSNKILDDVASYNWNWLMALLVTKMCGLLFLIGLEIYGCRKSCDERSKGNGDSEPGEEDAENTVGCCDKCQECTADCCKSCLTNLTILLLKIFFLIFGTVVTFLVLFLLSQFNRVTWGLCRSIDDKSLKSDCNTLSDSCVGNGQKTIYNVVFDNLNIDGPYWLNVGTSLFGISLWFVRFMVLRQRLNASKLAKV